MGDFYSQEPNPNYEWDDVNNFEKEINIFLMLIFTILLCVILWRWLQICGQRYSKFNIYQLIFFWMTSSCFFR